MEKIRVIIKNKWVLRTVVSLFLLTLWFAFTLYSIIKLDSAFSVLSYNHSTKSFTQLTQNKILAGEKVVGEFKGQEDNLGIVAIRFRTYQRVAYEDEDILIFRIKEKGQKHWYFEHAYKSGLFFNVPFYPFGFPKIADSKGNTYVFELQSTRGTDYNAVGISDHEPILSSKYQESKAKLLGSKKALFIFIVKKFVNSFQLFDIQFLSLVYLLPFILYVLTPPRLKNYYISQFITHLDLELLLLILVDIFVVQFQNDLTYLVFMSLWIAAIVINKMEESRSLLFGFFLLALCPFILIGKLDVIAENAASWAYLFLVICVFQSLFVLHSSKKRFD